MTLETCATDLITRAYLFCSCYGRPIMNHCSIFGESRAAVQEGGHTTHMRRRTGASTQLEGAIWCRNFSAEKPEFL